MSSEHNDLQQSFQYRNKAWHCVLVISYHASLPSVLLCFVQEVAQTVKQRSARTCGDGDHRPLAARGVPSILLEAMVILPLSFVHDTQPNSLCFSIFAFVSRLTGPKPYQSRDPWQRHPKTSVVVENNDTSHKLLSAAWLFSLCAVFYSQPVDI